jgi:hypothetical protein
MSIKELVENNLWEQYYVNKSGEKFPVTDETKPLFFEGIKTKDWSLVCQVKKKDKSNTL